MVKVISKYIEESGMDRIFVESGIYGENTLKKVLSGKHIKRSGEAHRTLYLNLLQTLIFVGVVQAKKPKTLSTS